MPDPPHWIWVDPLKFSKDLYTEIGGGRSNEAPKHRLLSEGITCLDISGGASLDLISPDIFIQGSSGPAPQISGILAPIEESALC
jgi:hypothetical protein